MLRSQASAVNGDRPKGWMCPTRLLQYREELALCRSAGGTAMEYVDRGVSGARDRRPALDRLCMANCKSLGILQFATHSRLIRRCAQ
jgi:hypothetical protein